MINLLSATNIVTQQSRMSWRTKVYFLSSTGWEIKTRAQKLHLLGAGWRLVCAGALDVTSSKKDECYDLTERRQRTKRIHFFHLALFYKHEWNPFMAGDLLQYKHLTPGGINFNVTSREDETIHRYNMCYLDDPEQSSLYKKDLNVCVCYWKLTPVKLSLI